MTGRASRFVAVGGLGFGVQMLAASVLLLSGAPPLVATLLAIETAIVHNHFWHRRWAWRDRADTLPWPVTLLRTHVGSGGTSLLVGVAVVAALSGHVPPLVAQVIAVGGCAVANFWIADRWVFGRVRPVTFFGLVLLLLPGAAFAAGPSREAVLSWERYVTALEEARTTERARGAVTWASDEDPDGARAIAALKRGEVVVTRRALPRVAVQDATLEHWQGSLLLRGVSLEDVAHRLRHPERYPQPADVRTLQVTSRTDGGHDLYLRLTRSMLVTATYDTWHRVRHASRPGRLESVSVASRIDEVDDAGTAAERRLTAAESRGFLWRMQSFWRFVVVPEGVVITCESVTLSRPVPLGLGLVARPVITRVARESMTTAVRAWQRGWP
jgi:putative flippase GtrA